MNSLADQVKFSLSLIFRSSCQVECLISRENARESAGRHIPDNRDDLASGAHRDTDLMLHPGRSRGLSAGKDQYKSGSTDLTLHL